MTEDKRPDPKPRRHPHLWQAYLIWYEVMELRKRHMLRISSAEKGKSDMDPQFEQDFLEAMQVDALLKNYKKVMANYGAAVGPIWGWTTSIKGLGEGGLAAQLLAQIDWIGPTEENPDNFSNVSKLWRYAGFAVMDGKAEKNERGEKSHFNAKLKGICYNIADQFIRQQTPHYVDIYYQEKARQRQLNPEPVMVNGKKIYTDGHIHNRAWRKMVKEFLKDLWTQWRTVEGLPVTEPYKP